MFIRLSISSLYRNHCIYCLMYKIYITYKKQKKDICEMTSEKNMFIYCNDEGTLTFALCLFRRSTVFIILCP